MVKLPLLKVLSNTAVRQQNMYGNALACKLLSRFFFIIQRYTEEIILINNQVQKHSDHFH